MDLWCPGFAGKQLHACIDTTRGTSAEEGRGGYFWEVFGVSRRILAGSWSRLFCVFLPSTRESRRASGKAAHPIVVVEAFHFGFCGFPLSG